LNIESGWNHRTSLVGSERRRDGSRTNQQEQSSGNPIHRSRSTPWLGLDESCGRLMRFTDD
jgi:hypothetical protein